MYLKKIVANGFKSFADKVVIALDRDLVAGIVGPNGSGKSNVIDAVRWVMGEQNAKMLRGEKSTDIIFAGSERRKALGMAEVSLVFDNSLPSAFCPPEYRHESEIELTRRIYIDGEREFLINRKLCRLKDIVNFFASAGIGGRSYSMIQQGQVDRILQAKPEEIREMIDEAAGISIFKQRKLETEKKLESITLNLSRLDDIYTEVTKQIANLKEQVQKAQEWQELSAKLKTSEIELFTHNFHFFKINVDELSQRIDEYSKIEADCITQAATLEGEYERKRAKLEAADPQLQWIHNQIISHREKIARLETELIHHQDTCQLADKELSNYNTTWQDDEAELERFSVQVQETDAILRDANQQIGILKERSANFDDRIEHIEEEERIYDQQIESFGAEKNRLDNMLVNLKDRADHLKKEMSSLARDKSELEERLTELDEDLSKSDILSEAMGVKISQYQKQISQYYQSKSRIEMELAGKEKDLKNRLKDIEDLQKAKIEFQVGFQTIEEIEKNSTDLPSLVAKYLALNQANAHPLTVLTDLVAFGEKAQTLSKRCQSVFEKWSERLVIQGPEEIEALNQFVKEQKWGIQPVSAISADLLASEEKARDFCQKKGLFTLADLLDYDGQNKALTAFLAHLVYLPDGREIPPQQAGELSGFTFFSEKGVVSEAGHTFFVGENEQGEGALSRKIKKEEFAQKLAELEYKSEKLRERCQKYETEIEDYRKETVQIDQNLLKANKITMELEVEARTMVQKLDLKREQTLELRRRYNQIDERSDEIAENLSDIEEERTRYKEDRDVAEEGLKEAKNNLIAVQDESEELKRQTSEAKLDLAKYLTKEATLREHYSQNLEQLERLRKHVAQRQFQITELQEKLRVSEAKADELKEDITELIFERETFEAELEGKKAKNAELVAEIKAMETQAKDLREELAKSRKVSSEARLELERYALALKGVKEQALEKYHIDLTSHDQPLIKDYDLKERQKAITQMKNRLDNFGAINMVAIDEYRVLCEREKFISEQKQDVFSSIDLLNTAINEIMEKSQTQYLETYRTLNLEFASLFPVLFPGGDGKLEMMDESDPLNSGVSIIVRLPGKNPQNMSLFSGGERALTAIALIFAFLKSKPTPFCFLDEVDAPLDETNVGRFNKILELLKDRFQFIVITHRRRTMEALDTLYGVTMQEPGVSKVVGVDLSQALPAHLQKAVKEFEPNRPGASARL